MNRNGVTLERELGGFRASFFAMASDCHCLIQVEDVVQAHSIADVVSERVWRLEQTYSRYRADSWLSQLNAAQGAWCEMSPDTARLFAFVDQVYQLSDGLFDPTSGILRRVWHFDGSDRLPSQEAVEALLPMIGWQRVERDGLKIRMPLGFELDLGGVVKEWAADAALEAVNALGLNAPVLINLGGDLRVSGPQANGQPWQVGVRRPGESNPQARVELWSGGLATSGDEFRFLLKEGRRLSHLLNPKTGWPVENAPRSVTAHASSCVLAGVLSSMALLKGPDALAFLEAQEQGYWMIE